MCSSVVEPVFPVRGRTMGCSKLQWCRILKPGLQTFLRFLLSPASWQSTSLSFYVNIVTTTVVLIVLCWSMIGVLIVVSLTIRNSSPPPQLDLCNLWILSGSPIFSGYRGSGHGWDVAASSIEVRSYLTLLVLHIISVAAFTIPWCLLLWSAASCCCCSLISKAWATPAGFLLLHPTRDDF